jgi:hypothetical protein
MKGAAPRPAPAGWRVLGFAWGRADLDDFLTMARYDLAGSFFALKVMRRCLDCCRHKEEAVMPTARTNRFLPHGICDVDCRACVMRLITPAIITSAHCV